MTRPFDDDSVSFTDDGQIRCDHADCRDGSTHFVSEWLSSGWLRVLYYCTAHATDNAERIDELDADETL